MTELAPAQTTPGLPVFQPLTASPDTSYYEHAGRILEVAGTSVRVLAELGSVQAVPGQAKHLALPPRLRRSVRGPVLDHLRLDLRTLTAEVHQTTRVSVSMIAQVVSGGRPVPGLGYERACSLMRAHLTSAGARDLADWVTQRDTDFGHGELAALMRAPWLMRFPAWARTYDVASGKVKLLPGDEAYHGRLPEVLALREVLSGEALATGIRRVLEMKKHLALPVQARHLSEISAPLRLLLAARGEEAVLDLLEQRSHLSDAAYNAVDLIHEDLVKGGPAHDRLQAAAQGLVRNPSRRPALISGTTGELYLSRDGARLMLPGGPESLAVMGRSEPRLIASGSDFRNAPPVVQYRDLVIKEGLLVLRFSRVRLQDGTVHHDNLHYTLERVTPTEHRLTTVNLMKRGRAPRVRTVTGIWEIWRSLGRVFTDLTSAEQGAYLSDSDDDLPF